jgi:hypothetical protein
MKKLLLIPFSFVLLVLSATPVYAHCPLCTGAVGIVAVSMQYYGIDTSVIGMFIGAFAISTGLWFGRKIKKEYIRYQLPLIVLTSFILTVIPMMVIDGGYITFPLLLFGEPGSLLNKIYWMDKILFGSAVGAVTTLFAFGTHNRIKKSRGRVLFPYQGLVLTLMLLGIAGTGLYLIGGV